MSRFTWLVLLVSLLAGCSSGPQAASSTAKPSADTAPTAGAGSTHTPEAVADAATEAPANGECQRCQADVAGHHNRFACATGCTFCATCALELGQRCPNCAVSLKLQP